MTRHTVEINLPMNPRKSTAVVDGKQLDSVTAIHIDGSYNDVPRLTLDLIAPMRIAGHAEVRLAESLVDDLKHLGWSEPGQYAHLAAAISDLLDAISDMAVRNSDVDVAADVLRGELVDAGWDEAAEGQQAIADPRPDQRVQLHFEPQSPGVRYVPVVDPRAGRMRA